MEKQYCKIAFLILNYETYWETEKCVTSIFETIGYEKINKGLDNIIIVDNGSKNDSFDRLNQKYGKVKGIHLLKNEENLGFAKGNNVGFKYIKKYLRVDFIVMINSDIIMLDSVFKDKLVNYYKKYKFAVAGPNVIGSDGKSINPMQNHILTADDCKERIKLLEREIILCKLKIEPFFAIVKRLKRSLKSRRAKEEKNDVLLNMKKGEQLHGSFLIFSLKYIDLFDGIYDKTFLYAEEILLRLRCERCRLTMCYLENIKALHNESRTEKYIGGDICARHLRRKTNALNSIKIVLEYLENPLLR